MKRFNPKYSGVDSEEIWEAINNLPEVEAHRLYSCFVLLQNLESTCLTWLNNNRRKE